MTNPVNFQTHYILPHAPIWFSRYEYFFHSAYNLHVSLLTARSEPEIIHVALDTLFAGLAPLTKIQFDTRGYQIIHKIYAQLKSRIAFAYFITHLATSLIWHIQWGIPHMMLKPQLTSDEQVYIVPHEYISLVAKYFQFPVNV